MKKALYRPFVGFLCAFILLSGIGFGISRANAENNYIGDIVYTSDTNNTYLGYHPIKISFFVKTSFDIAYYWDGSRCWSAYGFSEAIRCRPTGICADNTENPQYNRTILIPVNSNDVADIICPATTITYTAGNTYSFWLSSYYTTDLLNNVSVFNPTSPATFAVFTNSVSQTLRDTEEYPFIEYPTLNITYPFENAEISQAFYVQGSYTIPTGYDKLVAYVGVGIPYAQYSFSQNLIDPTGNINIRISGVPSGNYQMYFYFKGDSVGDYFVESATINFSILTAIPPELPETGETPPEFFDTIDADIYYLDFSSYDTPTALYNNLKSAIQPIFTIIGSNLTFFSSQFDQDTARETGEKTGEGILIIRTYSSNLNTFFNDLPVSEFLLFYLLLLIVVIVFRIIKNLINVIKP